MEELAIDVDLSLPAARVIRSINQIIVWHGKPVRIHSHNSLNAIF